MLFTTDDFFSTKEKVSVHVDCNTLVANLEAYKDTKVYEWARQNDFDTANKLACFILWDLCPLVKEDLRGCTYSLSVENGVVDLILSNATRCYPKALRAMEKLAEIITSNLNGTFSLISEID